MVPGVTRRRTLRGIVFALVALTVGCLGDDESQDEPDPDEGTNSYGIHIYNESSWEHTVDIFVEYAFEGEAVYEDSVTVDEDESETLNGIITDEEDHRLLVSIESDETDIVTEEDSIRVTPGHERAPPDANIRIRINELTIVEQGEQSAVNAYFESRESGQ